jgi:hypothetical protein
MHEYGHLPESYLCHGICIGTGGDVKDIEFAHCWIEFGDVVIDRSNGLDFLGRKEIYYKIGRVQYVERYTLREVTENMLKHDSYGGWSDRINDCIDEAFRLAKQRIENRKPIKLSQISSN